MRRKRTGLPAFGRAGGVQKAEEGCSEIARAVLDQFNGCSIRAAHLVDVRLSPAGPGFEPEDRGDHRLTAFACGLAKKVLRYFRVGLDVSAIKFCPIEPAKRRRLHRK